MFFLPPPPPPPQNCTIHHHKSNTRTPLSGMCKYTSETPITELTKLVAPQKSVGFFMPRQLGWNMSHMQTVCLCTCPLLCVEFTDTGCRCTTKHEFLAMHHSPSSAFSSHSTNFFICSRKTLLPLVLWDCLYQRRMVSSVSTSAAQSTQWVSMHSHRPTTFSTGNPLFKTWGRSEYSFACLATN